MSLHKDWPAQRSILNQKVGQPFKILEFQDKNCVYFRSL